MWPIHFTSWRFPQDGIYEPGSTRLLGRFHQLDTLIDGRMGRHPIQMPQLVQPHVERNSDGCIEPLWASLRELLNQPVELRLAAQAAEHDLRCEPGISGSELGGFREQQGGCIPALARLP